MWRAFSTGLTLALLAMSTMATAQHRPSPLRPLLRAADAVVLAHCDAGVSAWEGSPPIIVTRHQCAVERLFRGAAASSVTVAVLGGQVGGVGMQASAGATMTAADSVLLLRHSAFDDYFVIAGGTAGQLPVTTVAGERRVRGMSLDAFARLAVE